MATAAVVGLWRCWRCGRVGQPGSDQGNLGTRLGGTGSVGLGCRRIAHGGSCACSWVSDLHAVQNDLDGFRVASRHHRQTPILSSRSLVRTSLVTSIPPPISQIHTSRLKIAAAVRSALRSNVTVVSSHPALAGSKPAVITHAARANHIRTRRPTRRHAHPVREPSVTSGRRMRACVNAHLQQARAGPPWSPVAKAIEVYGHWGWSLAVAREPSRQAAARRCAGANGALHQSALRRRDVGSTVSALRTWDHGSSLEAIGWHRSVCANVVGRCGPQVQVRCDRRWMLIAQWRYLGAHNRGVDRDRGRKEV